MTRGLSPMPDPARVRSFGEYLRLSREARGMTLAEVAASTRVREAWLKAIDDCDLDSLPAEVFLRGFVRNYARAVGADPDIANKMVSARLRDRARSRREAEETVQVAPLPSPRDGGAGLDDDSPYAVPSVAAEGRTRAGVALAVIVLLIAATVAVSMLLRRPVPPAASISLSPPALLVDGELRRG